MRQPKQHPPNSTQPCLQSIPSSPQQMYRGFGSLSHFPGGAGSSGCKAECLAVSPGPNIRAEEPSGTQELEVLVWSLGLSTQCLQCISAEPGSCKVDMGHPRHPPCGGGREKRRAQCQQPGGGRAILETCFKLGHRGKDWASLGNQTLLKDAGRPMRRHKKGEAKL